MCIHMLFKVFGNLPSLQQIHCKHVHCISKLNCPLPSLIMSAVSSSGINLISFFLHPCCKKPSPSQLLMQYFKRNISYHFRHLKKILRFLESHSFQLEMNLPLESPRKVANNLKTNSPKQVKRTVNLLLLNLIILKTI